MASTPQQDLRKVTIGRTRPAAAVQTSGSPRTPLSRSVSSLYGSPTASFRLEEESLLVFEFGARYMRAGFAGESSARCLVGYSPEQQRRVGDYRQWELGYEARSRKRKRGQEWGEDYELWRVNVEEVDLDLVEDKVERVLREVEHEYLMLDNRPKKIVLIVSSVLPKPLLSSLLGTIFNTLQASTVTILPASVMAAVGAGVRSALVVDIGWAEAAVSAVYEYREITQWRSTRAGKSLSEGFAKMLVEHTEQALCFEDVEEVINRMAWCRNSENAKHHSDEVDSQNVDIRLPAPGTPLHIRLPFSRFANPVEEVLFARGPASSDLDDHDQPLHLLIYNALLHLPIDIRQLCMSRITFTGGVSNIPGLKQRLVQEVESLVEARGWDPVRSYGSAQRKRNEHGASKERNTNSQQLLDRFESTKISESTEDPPADTRSNIPAGLRQPEIDPIATKLHLQSVQASGGEPVSGVIRAVETLGAWAGASLVSNLRVRGVVEVERDKFLQHGLAGASHKKDVSVAQQRQSLGPGVKPGVGDRNSWTLGIWA